MLEPKKKGNRIVRETLASIHCKANFWGEKFFFGLFSATCILQIGSGPRTLGWEVRMKDPSEIPDSPLAGLHPPGPPGMPFGGES